MPRRKLPQLTAKYEKKWQKKPKRLDIIEFFIKKNNYKSYLEIGCHKDDVFSKINIKKVTYIFFIKKIKQLIFIFINFGFKFVSDSKINKDEYKNDESKQNLKEIAPESSCNENYSDDIKTENDESQDFKS